MKYIYVDIIFISCNSFRSTLSSLSSASIKHSTPTYPAAVPRWVSKPPAETCETSVWTPSWPLGTRAVNAISQNYYSAYAWRKHLIVLFQIRIYH